MGVKESSDVVIMSKNGRIHRKSDRSGYSWTRFFPSSTSTILIVYFILALLMNGGFNPLIRRGFFCNDSTIRYPIKTDTVSFKWLLVIALFIPSIVIKICDTKLTRLLDDRVYGLRNNLEVRRKSRKISDLSEKDEAEQEEEAEQLMTPAGEAKTRLVVNDIDSDYEAANGASRTGMSENDHDDHETLSEEALVNDHQRAEKVTTMRRGRHSYDGTMSHVKLYFFGFVSTAFFTGIGKMSAGRLRPHFLERCKPDIDCTLPSNMYRYIEDFNCTNNLRPRDLSYITTSWPSGHASMIFFSMLYLIIYLETVIPIFAKANPARKYKRLLNPIILSSIYVGMIGLAGYVSLTRVSDYHHHPTDVLSGMILGIIMAIVMAKVELKNRIPLL